MNPVVILTDVLKTPSKEGFKMPTRKSFKLLTPPRSTPSPASSFKSHPSKRKRKSSDSSAEYEIEEIVGYHRDKNQKMWYLIKWKGWSSEHNTFELIENLTGCNYKLMKFFEISKPSALKLQKKKEEIDLSLCNHEIYQALIKNNYRAQDLMEFSEKCLDISDLFKKKSLIPIRIKMEKEYNFIIRCLIGMYSHQDPGLLLRAQNYNIYLKLIKLREAQLNQIKESEDYINSLEKTLITIENQVDFEHFPKDLNYVVDFKHGEDVIIPKDPFLGCECPNGCGPKSRCCSAMAGSQFAYNPYGKLKISTSIPIYECNWRCRCPMTCNNRVVQKGRNVKLCIFKDAACGWGVKTLEKISKGTFVCEYIGEIIPDSEAVVRDIEYFKRRSAYIFDLDFCLDSNATMYCIDATRYGNVARFINHSCDPNLVVRPVWIDCLEPNMHRLGFFARKDIEKNQEIHIDYENGQTNDISYCESEEDKKTPRLRMIARIRCQCNSSNCRQWVFGNR